MPALRGIVDDAGSAAGSAWMDVVDTAVHRCAASRLHVTGGMSERCGQRTVTRVRRRAEASPRTATGARRLAVDATAKDIGRELECVEARVSAHEREEAPDKTAAERSQTGDRPLRCPPAQK